MAQEREESQGFFEMLWDCEFCDTKGLLAKSQRYCANCGGPQNPDKRYFPPEGQAVRVDGHQFVGADRACPACKSPMGAMAKNCTQCGSPLDGSAEVRGVVDPMAQPVQARAKPQQPRKKRRLSPIILGVGAVLAIAIWFFFIRAHEATVEVTGHSWKRVIAIEELNDAQDSAWRNEVPVNASALVCYDKQRTTRQVTDGEDCHMERKDKKDGTFEQVKKCSPKTRAEPVMDSWCTFNARRWRQVSELKNEGTGLTPAWPTGGPPADTAGIYLGAKRSGKQTETLTLQFRDHGTCDVADNIWRKYKDGQKIKVEVRSSSGDVACSSL
jgi:hypothetical protein